MKRPRIHPLGLSERHRSQQHARPIVTEAALRESRGLIIAAPHLVFVSLLRSRPQFIERRSYGGPAIMIMHLANLGVGIPGMEAMGGQPGITETEAAWFAIAQGAPAALGQGQKPEGRPQRSGRRKGIAVNPEGSVDPAHLQPAEAVIALRLLLQQAPCLPSRPALAQKAKRSESRCRGNQKCA